MVFSSQSTTTPSLNVRFLIASYWKHTKYSWDGYPMMEGIGVIGGIADDVFMDPGILNGVELAACTLAHCPRE
jgi:hypothetical protein